MYSDFTYTITSGATEIPVTPVMATLAFTGEDDEEVGAYPRRIDGELAFVGADFALLYDNWESAGQCAALPFNVKYQGATRYRGILRIGSANVRWDISNCRAYASIDPSGAYLCAKDSWETEFNVLGYKTETVSPVLGTLATITCTDSDTSFSLRDIDSCLTAPSGTWTVYRNQCTNAGGGNFDYSTTWIREEVTIACVSGAAVAPPGGWELVMDNCPTNATFARKPATDFNFDNSYFNVLDSYLEWYDVVSGSVEYDNGVLLNSVLQGSNNCTGLTVRSNFFNINPSGASPSGTVYETAADYLQSILIFQKSDIKRPGASQNATVANWTFKGLLQSLREQFNIRWRITPGTLRIEHASYFTGTQGLDLTAGSYAARIQGLHAYSMDNGRAARRERWQFMEETYYGFRGEPITYTECVPYDAEEEEIHDIGPVNNDITYIQNNTGQVSDEGFVFINAYANTASGTYHIITTDNFTGLAGAAPLLNGHMAIPSLLHYYHRHERMLPAGTLNGDAVTFDSTQRRRRQVDLSVVMSNADFLDWDESELINTQMGWGKVVRYRYDAKSYLLTLTLSYE